MAAPTEAGARACGEQRMKQSSSYKSEIRIHSESVESTMLRWTVVLSEVRAETALVPLYPDVLRNRKGASESTRHKIIQTALASGRKRTLHVSAVIGQEPSDRNPDPYPAYVASTAEVCGVNLSVPSSAASLSEKYSLRIVPGDRIPWQPPTPCALWPASGYADFEVTYSLVVPTGSSLAIPAAGQRISFSTLF